MFIPKFRRNDHEQKTECEGFYPDRCFDCAHVDHLHDYQHRNEHCRTHYQRILSCCRSNPQRNRDDAVAGKSPEERRVYNLRNNSGYPVFAGWRILADPCCADYWRGNLRFPDYGQK